MESPLARSAGGLTLDRIPSNIHEQDQRTNEKVGTFNGEQRCWFASLWTLNSRRATLLSFGKNMNLLVSSRNFTPVSIFAVFITALGLSLSSGGELLLSDYKISEIPAKRQNISISHSGVHINGKVVSDSSVSLELAKLENAVVYCEAGKGYTKPTVIIQAWALVVVESGGRFFYKQHRGSIDSYDHCYEYKKPNKMATPNQRSE